ncbi:MAG TPA: tetratricopeptide repeat protein [Polyangiaceae bacterium]|jgi:tetratricopeptide (TPR) repeat protein|nr:tetratricopeptide repeat protein [Polyangiaceae bacterium]
MLRALFFAVCLACGSSEPAPQHVEIAQPLPTVSVTASASAPVVQVASSQIDDARDLRRLTPRSRALVVTETQALENLAATTAMNSPDRPALLRRLAENYVELRRTGAQGASTKAIQHYTALVTSYPSYAQIDEVYYYLGLEYELTNDLSNARRTYYELIKRSAGSKYVPYAYYAFGEIFLAEAKSDPSKWDLARQAYTEVIKFSSPLQSVAYCRLGAVSEAQGDAKTAATWRTRAGATCGN